VDPNPANRYPSTAALVAALDRLAPDGSIRSDLHEVIVHDAPARSKLAIAALVIVLVGGAAGGCCRAARLRSPPLTIRSRC
jgi:hypothetical protein